MVNFSGLAENIYIGARKWIKPDSFKAIQYVPKTLEKDVVEITQKPSIVGVPLDKTSYECEYFGVDSYEHLGEKILNHDKLYKAKEKWCINHEIGCIMDYCDVIMNKKGIEDFKNYLSEKFMIKHRGIWSRIQEFDSFHSARMTCHSEIFGKTPEGYPALHTVGLVSKGGNLYILDSLGEQIPSIKEFHSMLKEIFKDFGYEKIIFSTKPQQPMDEFTCNNWTYANIESLLKALYDKKMKIETSEELNKILPENINEILKEQWKSAIWVD